tara:strand:- start:15265 stop:15777 length:513 start_codon:yes stop_codon:yes gene_type:complete
MFFFKSFASSNYEKLIYDFKINSVDGKVIDFSDYKDKVILLVNVASYCGFTNQYADLQKLWETFEKKDLIVIGVPSGSFNQEKNSNKEVKEFCEVNFNINFPITSIYDVKGENAHDIYKWAKLNHGKSAIPKWNFHKILIGKNGKIIETFAPFTNPMSKKVIKTIEKVLK